MGIVVKPNTFINMIEYINNRFVWRRTTTQGMGKVFADIDEDCTCRAMVLPGDSAPLLGLIPLESMDVIIDARREELVVNPSGPMTRL